MLNRYKAYLTQFSRTEDLNKRIYSRNNPSQNLMIPISFRSIETRTTMPVPIKMEDTEKIICPNENVFIPGVDTLTGSSKFLKIPGAENPHRGRFSPTLMRNITLLATIRGIRHYLIVKKAHSLRLPPFMLIDVK